MLRISDSTYCQDHTRGREGIKVVVHQGKAGEGTGNGAYGETLVHKLEVLHILQLLLYNLHNVVSSKTPLVVRRIISPTYD